MASKLDQALDEVIKDRRSDQSGKRSRRTETSFLRRQDSGNIRKRLGNNNQSPAIRSFVRTVNVQPRGNRNVDGQWSHDLFDDDHDGGRQNIMSRLGNVRGRDNHSQHTRGVEISIENLHYDVTEKDVEELFSTVGQVLKAHITFDASGRSTGNARVKYSSMSDAEKAVSKYNNVELDGQTMRIEIKEYTERRHHGGRSSNSHSSRFGRKNTRHERRDTHRSERRKEKTAEDLDKEMDSYMQSNVNNNTRPLLLYSFIL
ncbi:uncharacterized protein B0P05DRAFT_576675 [Gilbertella persicaria]|uniref:uncharacterized protein n=1 Tax=Gilbertella persicaria TaxID=101096 RepID=UPI00221FBF64|nr:uncharacterized protein B0P05DRAFT_576675 [Gilbertella persicaria]KAI8098347.1 hypothetical protein B0P05DRAFT_576675 [Gilbertella persicaria]